MHTVPEPLPFRAILAGAVDFNRRHARALALSFWPLVATVAGAMVAGAVGVQWAYVLGLLLAGVAFYGWVTAWHRLAILGESPRWHLGGRELIYFWLSACFLIAVFLLVVVFSVAAAPIVGLARAPLVLLPFAVVLAVWLTAPILVVLPALSAGHELTLTRAGHLLRHSRWRFVAVTSVVPMAAAVLDGIARALPLPLDILLHCVTLLSYPLEVTVLSLSYLWLTTGQLSATATTEPTP